MTSKFRIVKTKKGYIVEVQEVRWSFFGLKIKWIPFIKTSGLEECWPHSSKENALLNLFQKVKEEL
jgi:hypothetical protein